MGERVRVAHWQYQQVANYAEASVSGYGPYALAPNPTKGESTMTRLTFNCGCTKQFESLEAAQMHADRTGHILSATGTIEPAATDQERRLAAPSRRVWPGSGR